MGVRDTDRDLAKRFLPGSGFPKIEGVRWCGTSVPSLLEHPSPRHYAGNTRPGDSMETSFRVLFSSKLSGLRHYLRPLGTHFLPP